MRQIALLAIFVPVVAASAQRSAAENELYASVRQDLSALEDSLMSIPSSGQRAAALRRAGQTDDRGTLMTVIRVARSVPSSTDRVRVLEAVAPRFLARGDRALSDAFFRAARTVPSSEELRDLLIEVVAFAAKSEYIANAIIEVARIVPSSSDRSDVLTALVQSGAVRTDDLRVSFVDALREIPSETDRQRVARAATKGLKD